MTSLFHLFLLVSLLGSAEPKLEVEIGVTETGTATSQWLAMIRKRLPDAEYQAVAPLRKPLAAEEQKWVATIRARVGAWEQEIPGLAVLFDPVTPPPTVRIVLGNRGASDAFTHDPTTIGFDLASMQAEYGDAGLPENGDRLDRIFRHEYVHLLQKAWLAVHPYRADTPLRAAILDMWAEGLGNYFSLSERWRMQGNVRTETAARALAALEPRLVTRLAALACASPQDGAALMADLSIGRFDRKWGAVTPALWLDRERQDAPDALRQLVLAGPDGIWPLAERNLSEPLRPILAETRLAAERCGRPEK